MATRWRATAAALVCALHLALFVPTIGDWSSVLVNDFAPQAQAIKGGEKPYRDQKIEYPPLSGTHSGNNSYVARAGVSWFRVYPQDNLFPSSADQRVVKIW